MYSFKLTKNIIGIDIGSYSLKIVECQRAGEKVHLLNYEIRRWPKPRDPNQPLSREEISAFIRQTLNELGIRPSDTVSQVTGPLTVARHLFMPDLADDEMREAIRWGAKSDFPFSLEEAIIDFHKLGVSKREEGEREAEIVSAVSTREVVEDQVALLRETGLKPLFLSIPPFSLMQAYRLAQPPPWSETAALIDLGHKNTRIIVLKEGKLKFSREIAVAGDAFTQSLTGPYQINGQEIEIDEALAERIKLKSSLLEEDPDLLVEGIPVDQIQKRLGSVMDRLILEVERSLTYYKNQFKDYETKRVFLTGGGSLLKGLRNVLEKNLDLPVQPFQEIGSITLKKKINQDLFLRNLPFLTTVLGMITQIHPFVNLSRAYVMPQVKKVSAGNYLRPVLAGALLLSLFLGFGLPYLTMSRQVDQLRKEIIAKKGQLARVGRAAEEMARMEQEETALNKVLEGVPKIETPKIPMGDLFQELSRLVPSNMTLTQFQFSKAQETQVGLESKGGSPKPEPVGGKTGESLRDEGKRAYHLIIQGIVFGSDQEIIATLSEFTGKLNRSLYFKEAKFQTTLKTSEYSKPAAEFKVLAKIGERDTKTPGVSS